jgi:hypothetical protein
LKPKSTAGAYIVVMAGVAFALPGVNEVPEDFPATVLWQFPSRFARSLSGLS